jgi:hypothetical protein
VAPGKIICNYPPSWLLLSIFMNSNSIQV